MTDRPDNMTRQEKIAALAHGIASNADGLALLFEDAKGDAFKQLVNFGIFHQDGSLTPAFGGKRIKHLQGKPTAPKQGGGG